MRIAAFGQGIPRNCPFEWSTEDDALDHRLARVANEFDDAKTLAPRSLIRSVTPQLQGALGAEDVNASTILSK